MPPLELPRGWRRLCGLAKAGMNRAVRMGMEGDSVRRPVLESLEASAAGSDAAKLRGHLVCALAHGLGKELPVRRAAKRLSELEAAASAQGSGGGFATSALVGAGRAAASDAVRSDAGGGSRGGEAGAEEVASDEALRRLACRLSELSAGGAEPSAIREALAEARAAGAPRREIARLHALHCTSNSGGGGSGGHAPG
mmetsp:Transcript_149442/g.479854  ORF Transcript_149442/g.479854 Transcript_149442/m.479854 type:complete len:197 (+) Transcript_149442:422-1012(+)